MDLKERLARLEQRRGETSDQWMAEYHKSANEETLLLAEALANAKDNELEEIVDVIGSLEHYKEYESISAEPFFTIGFENISETVVRIFDRIIAFIKRWIKVLADADFRLSVHTGLMSMALENIRTNMRTTSRSPKTSPHFLVTTRINNLCVNQKPISNAQMLLNSLTILNAVTDMYFNKHSESVLRQVSPVTIAVGSQKKASDIANIIEPTSPLQSALVSVFRQQGEHVESPHLMGNHRLVITNEQAGSADALSRIQGIRVKVVPSQLTQGDVPASIPFQYFDQNMAEAILAKCDGLLKLLGDSNTSARRHSRRQAMQALLASVERVNDEAQRKGIRDLDDARNVVAVLETYISWIADPYTSFYAFIQRNIKAAMNVCEANAA